MNINFILNQTSGDFTDVCTEISKTILIDSNLPPFITNFLNNVSGNFPLR